MKNWRAIVVAFMMLLIVSIVVVSAILTDAANSIGFNEFDNFNRTVKSCEQAQLKANRDFSRGKIRMFFKSGFDADRNEFPNNFYEQLENNYDVEVVLVGDVGGVYFGCYNLTMDSLVSQRTGDKTIEKLYNKLHAEKYGQ